MSTMKREKSSHRLMFMKTTAEASTLACEDRFALCAIGSTLLGAGPPAEMIHGATGGPGQPGLTARWKLYSGITRHQFDPHHPVVVTSGLSPINSLPLTGRKDEPPSRGVETKERLPRPWWRWHQGADTAFLRWPFLGLLAGEVQS
ncbi:hypothetical protein ACP4OV_024609 [Aristida adscensionis]